MMSVFAAFRKLLKRNLSIMTESYNHIRTAIRMAPSNKLVIEQVQLDYSV